MSDAVQIPEGLVPPSRINPQCALLYANPKVGKTTLAAMLPDSLILELEPAGADFVAARKIDIPDMKTLRATLEKLTALRAAGTPACRRLVIDTIDEVEVLCDPAAVAEYKASVMGKDFVGTSITELPMGAGYGRLREMMGQMLWLFTKAAEEVLLLGHVREKFIDRKGVQEVAAQDVSLTGKVRSIVCSRCSTIGYLRRDFTNTVYANFATSDTVNCGSRCAHLTGREIVLSEKKDGKIVAYWERFYLPDAPATPKEGA